MAYLLVKTFNNTVNNVYNNCEIRLDGTCQQLTAIGQT